MKNISLYVIVDNLFKFILLFLLNLIWCLYLIDNSVAAIVISILMSVTILLLTNKIGHKRKKNKISNLKKQQHIEDVRYTFLTMSNYELCNFFYNLVKTRHDCKIENNSIVINTMGLPIILTFNFKCSNLTRDDILTIYKQHKTKKIKRLIILTNSIDSNTISIISGLEPETMILDYKQTYTMLLEEYSFYPKIIPRKTKAKNTFKQILAYSLNKKKTKGYLLSAIVILFASLFVRYKLYYTMFSSILIILAIFSYFNPSFNTKTKSNILD